jgi:hypothetical protein
MLDICARNCFVAEVLPPFLPVYFLFSLLVLPLFVMVWPQRKEREGLKRTLAKESTTLSVWCRKGLRASNLSSYHPKLMRVIPLENL